MIQWGGKGGWTKSGQEFGEEYTGFIILFSLFLHMFEIVLNKHSFFKWKR